MTDIEIVNLIAAIIANHEKFRSSIKRSPHTYAERRAYEKKYRIPEQHFEYCGHRYSVEYIVDCSGYTVYAKGIYYRDDQKTTLTAIKNVQKQLFAKGVFIC
ncbi:MAG: hypothetical protein J6Q19_00615 [Bacteroidaceae bacterium]|nr:hypothetical protein [Bacteroidaceae bacterium]